jgi:hypothetical protein
LDPIRVVCVKWGDKYSDEYPLRLKSMVARHLSLPHTFECFTEKPVEGVDCLPLTCEWPGWWQKIGLFKPGVLTTPTVYFDLDVVMVGSLEWVAEYFECDLAMPIDWGSGALAGCIMITNGRGKTAPIWHQFGQHVIDRLHPYGDQDWITMMFKHRATIIPDGVCMSYKRHCRAQGSPPVGASVIAFHGKPDPHEVSDQWVIDAWR